MKRPLILIFAVAVAFVLVAAYVATRPDASASAFANPEKSKLYLYFPTSSDSTFPEYDPDAVTSPLAAFDVSDLDSGIGTTANLRDRIFEIVSNDYTEFNVDVVLTTSKPSPTEARWQIVGIGSDSETIFGSNLFGVAQAVDINDSDAQDYARVYADSFGAAYGGTGGALNGSDSTLERWARAIGHTTSHEAGHNYGLGHGNSAPVSGSVEDAQNNHVLATGSTGLTGEIRASRQRHFSDTSYEILGHNIGLTIRTLYNWDFVNPNDEDAHSLILTILSEASSLSINWVYTGSLSPWASPTITKKSGTQSFQGTNYNIFELTFSTDKSWSGGSDGVAPPGVKFHVGATFNESDAVLVYEATLQDSGGSDLDLHPRVIGFDAGALDLSSGDFELSIFNPNPEDGPLQIIDLQVWYLPRLVDIEAMVAGVELVDIRGLPVEQRRPTRDFQTSFEVEERTTIQLASLIDKRHVDITYDPTDCKRGFVPGEGPSDTSFGEIEYCPDGTALSLFPSTSVYITATVVDPDAKYFNPDTGEFETGPLESHVFYQFAGFVPDFNNNGVDDLLDIREGTSIDENGNGVPDEAEERAAEEDEDDLLDLWWLYLIILILLLVLIAIVIIIRRRRRPRPSA